jgi:DNA-binding SARP family transcriptional activator
METRFCNYIPDFGVVIARQRALSLARANRPSLVLVAAPAGYGKSVFAAQLASSGAFDESLWIPGMDDDVQAEHTLASVAMALAASGPQSLAPSASSTLSRGDAALSIAEGLRARSGVRLCLVLDGYDNVRDLTPLRDLAALMRGLAEAGSCLVVTCRHISPSSPPDPTSILLLDESDLRLTETEIAELQLLVGIDPASAEPASRLLERYRGHPAITALMLRHVDLAADRVPPKDLVWYVERLVETIPARVLGYAYVGSLLMEDELRSIADCTPAHDALTLPHELASLAPLLVMSSANSGEPVTFRVHAVLRDVVRRRAERTIPSDERRDMRDAVLRRLNGLAAYTRMCAVLQWACQDDEVIAWSNRCGGMMLRHAGPAAVLQLLEGVGAASVSGVPSLLLLLATAQRELERHGEAHKTALLCAQLAELGEQHELWSAAMLLEVRLALDTSRFGDARKCLEQMEARGQLLELNSIRLMNAYMSVVDAHEGMVSQATHRAQAVLETLNEIRDWGSAETALVVNCVAGVEALCLGRWSAAAKQLSIIADRPDLPPTHSITARANLASCYVELGCLEEALRRVNAVIEEARAAGLSQIEACAYGTRAALMYGRGACTQGQQDWQVSQSLSTKVGDDLSLLAGLNSQAVCSIAQGLFDDALQKCEQARMLSEVMGSSVQLHAVQSKLGMAAALAGLGDAWGARAQADEARQSLPESGADGHVYRTDLILAEVDRQALDVASALLRLSTHVDYILSGSANWLTAMHIRAFPGLLGLIVRTVGADAVPLRLLRMIPCDVLRLGLCASPYLEDEEVDIIRRRCGDEAETLHGRLLASPPTPCLVRVFGGLEVTTPQGTVEDADWRKRKARLLFLNLVLRQHQDTPRDVLLERLWPDMDEEHALRNFYVTWSTMKRALSCTDTPSDAKALVQCTGGVCRVTRLVRSDLDEFDEALSAIRAAAGRGDGEEVQRAAESLFGIYRGELLPGDLYEEWFTAVRERTKHDFCDAMMLASSFAESAGRGDEALTFLRKASAADPWREDVYQAMMRCQMGIGQRSRAIETYFMCRSRLTEDLGIDPSVETTRLYQAVLAMDAADDPMIAEGV